MAEPNNALGEFLRARRSRVRPEDIGLSTSSGFRRTPGLRREELATIAGVSVDYYVRLEQGRERNPSAAVLGALSRVLSLDAETHRHLLDLAAKARPGPGHRSESAVTTTYAVRPSVRALLEAVEPLPGYLLNRVNDILAANTAGGVLMAGMDEWPTERHNTSRYVFMHPNAKDLFANWDDIAWGTAAHLRAEHGRAPGDSKLLALVSELTVGSAEFRRLWRQHDVRRRTSGRKVLNHPDVGRLTLTYETLKVSESDERLVVYQCPPGTADHDAMMRLNLIGRRVAASA